MLVQFSGIGVTDARGKLGSDVFTRSRYGAMVRKYVYPTNTITPARTAIRDAYADIYALWNSLTDFERDLWSMAANNAKRKSKLGHVYASTGKDLFVGCNMSLVTASQFPVLLPNVLVNTQPPRQVSLQLLVPSGFRIRVSNYLGSQTVPAGVVYVVSASPGVSASALYPRNNWRIIDVLASGSSTSNVDLSSAYSAVFPPLVSGLRYFVKVHSVVVNSGRKSSFVLTSEVA